MTGVQTCALPIFVPYTAGGPNDILARKVSQRLKEIWQVPVVVENQGGANSLIGTEYVARSLSDGHTLLVNTINVVTSFELSDTNPFLWKRNLIPVGYVGSHRPYVVVVSSKSTITSYRDLIAVAKKKPLTYGTPGKGTMHHLYGAWFGQSIRQEQIHVPYKGVSPAVIDLVAGNIDMMFVPYASIQQFVANKSLRPLLVLNDQEIDSLPGVVSAKSQNITNYPKVRPTFLFWAPVGTPTAILVKLEQDINTAYQQISGSVAEIGRAHV